MNQEDWNAELGDEASLIPPPLKQTGFSERPNGPSFGFSPRAGFGDVQRLDTNQHVQNHFGGYSRSRDTGDFLDRQHQTVSRFGSRSNFARRGSQERKVAEDCSTQSGGFKGFPGGFGQNESNADERTGKPNSGVFLGCKGKEVLGGHGGAYQGFLFPV